MCWLWTAREAKYEAREKQKRNMENNDLNITKDEKKTLKQISKLIKKAAKAGEFEVTTICNITDDIQYELSMHGYSVTYNRPNCFTISWE